MHLAGRLIRHLRFIVDRLGAGLDRPIKDVVILETLSSKKVAEQFAKVRVVWLVVKTQGATIIEVYGKLVGESANKCLSRSSHFLKGL